MTAAPPEQWSRGTDVMGKAMRSHASTNLDAGTDLDAPITPGTSTDPPHSAAASGVTRLTLQNGVATAAGPVNARSAGRRRADRTGCSR